MKTRTVEQVFVGKETRDGAGVRLVRVFGYHQVPTFDPFLLLDAFGSDNPDEYRAGFPWHPHRGIETITYVIAGDVEHGDSLGNTGTIGSGDVQWMTAGSGIVHQEMPLGDEKGVMRGFQLWANLPKSHKMMAPRYRDICAADIPSAKTGDGVEVKVICGKAGNVEGPVTDVVINPTFLAVSLAPSKTFEQPVPVDHTAFLFVYEGSVKIGDEEVAADRLALLGDGDGVEVAAGVDSRFIFVAGKPLGEPVAWGGPIVMNTKEEVERAFEEYADGTFIK